MTRIAHRKQLTDELRAAVRSLPSKDLGDRLEAALLRSEIRRAASSMNQQQIEILYRGGDSAIRSALEELPSIKTKGSAVIVRPFITDELQEEVLFESARRALPEVAEMVDDIKEIGGIYEAITAAVKNEVKRHAPGAIEPAKPRIVA